MLLNISQSALERALSVVSKCVDSDSSTPIVGGVLISAENGTVSFTTVGQKASAVHAEPANVIEEGKSVLSCKLLLDTVKTLPDAVVQISESDGQGVIKCEGTELTLSSMDPRNFPSFEDVVPTSFVEVPLDVTSRMAKIASRICAIDTTRPNLAGISTSVENGVLSMYASDSYRMVALTAKVGDGSFQALIPGEAMGDALSILQGDVVTIGSTDTQVIISTDKTKYVSKVINSTPLPNPSQFVPASPSTRVTVQPKGLLDSLKRMRPVAVTNPALHIHIEDDELVMDVSNPMLGHAVEKVKVDVEGNSNRVALNHKYLLDCASSCPNEMHVDVMNERSPVVVRGYGDFDYTMILMPIMW